MGDGFIRMTGVRSSSMKMNLLLISEADQSSGTNEAKGSRFFSYLIVVLRT